jgi:hypothetical protein
MPSNGERVNLPDHNAAQDRPILYQKFFKSGNKTYASQVKLGNNGKKYLVLTEGYRDPDTQEVKKHYMRVFENDLKEFFSMLQETVVYLRTHKDDAQATIAGLVAPKPAEGPAAPPAAPAKAAKSAAPRPTARKPVIATKPAVTSKAAPKPTRYAKPASRGR